MTGISGKELVPFIIETSYLFDIDARDFGHDLLRGFKQYAYTIGKPLVFLHVSLAAQDAFVQNIIDLYPISASSFITHNTHRMRDGSFYVGEFLGITVTVSHFVLSKEALLICCPDKRSIEGTFWRELIADDDTTVFRFRLRE